jgi:hypothetical protein
VAGNANAGRDVKDTAFDVKGGVDHGNDFPGDELRFRVVVQALQDHNELVTGQARDGSHRRTAMHGPDPTAWAGTKGFYQYLILQNELTFVLPFHKLIIDSLVKHQQQGTTPNHGGHLMMKFDFATVADSLAKCPRAA